MSKSQQTPKNTSFRQRHGSRGGDFHDHQSGLAVRRYENQSTDLIATALEKAALIELPETGILEVEGPDAANLLHLLLTQEIATMSVGESCWSSALNRHGRIINDLQVWRRTEHRFLLICPPGQVSVMAENIAFHRVSEEIKVRSLSDSLTRCLIFGARIAPVLGLPSHNEPIESHDMNGVEVWSGPTHEFNIPSRDVLAPADQIDIVIEEFEKRGGTLVGTDVFEGVRIESGVPLWNVDATTDDFPNECGFTNSMAFTKGCYLGQEIVGRIFQLGPRTKLMGVRFHGAEPPQISDLLVFADGPAVELTSIAWCPRSSCYGGLTVVPTKIATPGLELWLQGHPEQSVGVLSDLPFPEAI